MSWHPIRPRVETKLEARWDGVYARFQLWKAEGESRLLIPSSLHQEIDDVQLPNQLADDPGFMAYLRMSANWRTRRLRVGYLFLAWTAAWLAAAVAGAALA